MQQRGPVYVITNCHFPRNNESWEIRNVYSCPFYTAIQTFNIGVIFMYSIPRAWPLRRKKRKVRIIIALLKSSMVRVIYSFKGGLVVYWKASRGQKAFNRGNKKIWVLRTRRLWKWEKRRKGLPSDSRETNKWNGKRSDRRPDHYHHRHGVQPAKEIGGREDDLQNSLIWPMETVWIMRINFVLNL